MPSSSFPPVFGRPLSGSLPHPMMLAGDPYEYYFALQRGEFKHSRHPSESWDLRPQSSNARDSGFRRNDGLPSISSPDSHLARRFNLKGEVL